MLLITWVLKWFGFLVGFCVLFFWHFFNFGVRPYLNLLQLCVSAMGRLGSLREPGVSLEQCSPPLLFSEELQCKTQSCYTLVEREVSRNCLSAGHGMDPKLLTRPYPHSIWHWFVMGTVSGEMSPSAVSYTLMSPARVLVRSWQACFSFLSLLFFCSSIRTLDLIAPSFSGLIIVSENLCPFALISVRVCLSWQRKSCVLDTLNYTDSRTRRNRASEQPSCELSQLERSQPAGRAVLSQAEGSPRLHPVSDQPVVNAQQKSTGAGQVQRYFLHFILPASGSLEFRDFLIQSCVFISAV